MGMRLRYGSKVTKKKKKEKKKTLVFLKDQTLHPKRTSVIPIKAMVRKERTEPAKGIVYAAE